MEWLALVIQLKYQHARSFGISRVIFHYNSVLDTIYDVPRQYVVIRHFVVAMIGNLDISTTN